MRALRFAAALALAASPALAQVPEVAAPVAAANAPASSSFEVRVGGLMLQAERSTDFYSQFSTETGSVKGVEVLLRSKIIGLSVRSMSGDFGESMPQVVSADARVLIGPSIFTVQLGAARRALSTSLGNNLFEFGIAGVSTTMRIGGTGLRGLISAAAYMPTGDSKLKMKGGVEGEASIIYTLPPPIPLYLQLGYRTEVFVAKSGTNELPEELRGIRIGGGFQLGGR